MDYIQRHEKITSRSNSIIKHAVKLNNSARYRMENRQFFIEGVRLCGDALISGINIEKMFYTSRITEKFPYIIKQFEAAGIAGIYEISDEICEKLSDTTNAQGIFCICTMPLNKTSADELDINGKYILLENISNPSNLGAVIRTAEALGINGAVLSPGCCDLYNPKTLRASMGSVFRFPAIFTDSFAGFINDLNDRGMITAASVPDVGAEKITQTDLSKGCAVVIGNEGNGITEEIQKVCSMRITIPMLGRAESLNAATAATIIMWEMVK